MEPLTLEQAESLLQKKQDYVTANNLEGGVCTNPKCRCVECSCGAGCTCNVSPESTCDPCTDFRAAMMAKKNGSRFEAAENYFKETIAGALTDAGVVGISASELKEVLAEPEKTPLLLVDCRSDVEHSVSTLPGAISAQQFKADLLLADGKLVVAYCTMGSRSGKFVEALIVSDGDKPWTAIKNLEVGIVAWCHSGGVFADASGESTTKVHAFKQTVVDMMPVSGYEVVVDPAPQS